MERGRERERQETKRAKEDIEREGGREREGEREVSSSKVTDSDAGAAPEGQPLQMGRCGAREALDQRGPS